MFFSVLIRNVHMFLTLGFFKNAYMLLMFMYSFVHKTTLKFGLMGKLHRNWLHGDLTTWLKLFKQEGPTLPKNYMHS